MTGIIYKITNPKGKIYIGQTIDVKSRFYNYEIKNCKNQIKLYRSILKYGWESHNSEIIEECVIERLNTQERYWQDFYDVLNNGLNLKLTNNGEKSGKISEETKLKIGKSNSGKSGSFRGRSHTEESKLKMRISKPKGFNIGRKITWNTRPDVKKVIQKDKEGDVIKIWDNVKQINEELKINVYDALEKRNKTAGGFIWVWYNEL
jgi:group I intron endonuclease